MARVLAASFGPDKLFQVMFPRKDQYPDDLIKAFRRGLEVDWWDYSKVLMVSYEVQSSADGDADDERQHLTTRRNNQNEVITGMGEWQRVGLGWEHVWNVLGWWDPRKLSECSCYTSSIISTVQAEVIFMVRNVTLLACWLDYSTESNESSAYKSIRDRALLTLSDQEI